MFEQQTGGMRVRSEQTRRRRGLLLPGRIRRSCTTYRRKRGRYASPTSKPHKILCYNGSAVTYSINVSLEQNGVYAYIFLSIFPCATDKPNIVFI